MRRRPRREIKRAPSIVAEAEALGPRLSRMTPMVPSERSVLVTSYAAPVTPAGGTTPAPTAVACAGIWANPRPDAPDRRACQVLARTAPKKDAYRRVAAISCPPRAGCGGCDLPILAGQRLVRLSNGTYRHETCAEPGMLT